jgi:4-amino-4-deoxy-L-arabinose transferase-like glycosyltransferase
MALVASPPVSIAQRPSSSSWLDRLRILSNRRWICWLCLGCYCGWLFFYGLTEGEFYRTESLRAIIAAEFLRSGDWIVPTLYGEPLFTKPPGMYAAIALTSWPFGQVEEWTARLPSAIAATSTVILFYWHFGRHLGRRSGLVAALILPMSFLWLDKSSTAEIDMLQTFWVSAAILLFLRGLEFIEERRSKMEDRGWEIEDGQFQAGNHGDPIESLRVQISKNDLIVLHRQSSILDPRSSTFIPPSSILNPSALWLWWMLALLCVAGGVLTKWTGGAFFYGTIIPLLWWRGQLRLLWGRHHLVCAGVAAAIVLAWIGAAAAMTDWHTLFGTVSREGLMRLSPAHHHRSYPWAESLVHPLRLLAASLPCGVFALLSLRPGFASLWDLPGRHLLQAFHCWTWPNMLFWTVIPEHATRHSFPLFPGLAGLAALVWIAWLRKDQIPRTKFQEPTSKSRVPASLVLAPGRLVLGRRRIAPWFVGLVVCWLIVKLVFVQAVLPRRNPARQPREKAEQLAATVPDGNTLYLFRLKDEGIMFYYRRPVRRLSDPDQLPSSQRPIYCILDESEWRNWDRARPSEMLLRMRDEQGDPMVLVRVDSKMVSGE